MNDLLLSGGEAAATILHAEMARFCAIGDHVNTTGVLGFWIKSVMTWLFSMSVSTPYTFQSLTVIPESSGVMFPDNL